MTKYIFVLFIIIFFVSQSYSKIWDNPAKGPYSIEGKIKKCKNPSEQRIEVQGNSGFYTTIPTSDGSFEVNNIPAGAYILNVVSMKYNFSTIKIHISAKYDGKIKAKLINETNKFVKYPLELTPTSNTFFLLNRPPYDIFAIIKPLLFVVGGAGILFFFSKQLDNDAFKEVQEQGGFLEVLKSAMNDDQENPNQQKEEKPRVSSKQQSSSQNKKKKLKKK
eukprot:TRINITY_DN594_c4_g1_i1.p1 TRINITY_DN594_c4_g1~~TRINITY_DN594_c4_g1_i1.p1  ORF type:complete len:220 (+),score=54.76 TRINITY_DN594_c4_g1_i1:65-724(+)